MMSWLVLLLEIVLLVAFEDVFVFALEAVRLDFSEAEEVLDL